MIALAVHLHPLAEMLVGALYIEANVRKEMSICSVEHAASRCMPTRDRARLDAAYNTLISIF